MSRPPVSIAFDSSPGTPRPPAPPLYRSLSSWNRPSRPQFSGEVDVENDLSVKSISGTKINWKAGKQLTLRKPKRRTRGGGGRRGRGRREPEPEETEDPSVFCYFERELDPAALMAKQLGEVSDAARQSPGGALARGRKGEAGTGPWPAG